MIPSGGEVAGGGARGGSSGRTFPRRSCLSPVAMGRSVFLVVGFIAAFLIPVSMAQASALNRFSNYRFSMEPRDALVVGGVGHTLNCSTQLSDGIIIEWFRNDQFIDLLGSPYHRALATGALEILPGIPDELLGGVYYCTIVSRNLGTIESRKAKVTLATLGEITSPFGVTVYPSDTARFECNVNSTAPTVTTWQKDRQVIDLTEERYASRYTLLPSGALEIQDVRATDAGSYRCRVESPLLPNERRRSTDAELVVRRDPPPAQRPDDLAFLVAPGPKIEALIGSTITLEAATTEPATLTWFKGDKPIPETDHYRRLGQGSLQISELGEIDTGIYRVVATSLLDNSRVERGVRVDVQVPPQFLEVPSNTYANVGTTKKLTCAVYGIPTPSLVWKGPQGDLDPSLPSNDFLTIDWEGLTIQDLTTSDSGMYQCFASNPWGNIQATAQLIVLPEGVPLPVIPDPTDPPPMETRPPTLPPVLTTITPEVRPPELVPTAPLDLAAMDVQPQSVLLSWRPPLDTRGTLTGYRVYLRKDEVGARNRSVEVNADQLSKLVTDLLPNQAYRIWVRAENRLGPGAESEVIIINTPDDTRVTPDEVTDLRATPLSSTSMEFSWRPPFDTYGELTHYILQLVDKMSGARRELHVGPDETSYVVDNMLVYTPYDVTVIPHNANGPGGTSTIEVRTPGAAPTGMPSNVSVNPVPSVPNALDVAWVPPLIYERNGEITQYKLRYKTKGGEVIPVPVAGTATSFRIAGLQRDTEYEVRIAMVNVNGTGPFTDWHLGMTEDIAPNGTRPGQTVELETPLQVVATPLSARSIMVTWKDQNPASTVQGITRYYTIAYSNRKQPDELHFLNATEQELLVTGLDPYNGYDFAVQVVEGNRVSEYSLYAYGRTLEAVPGSAPQEVTVTDFANSSTSVAVSWKPPLLSNGNIRRYIVFYGPKDPSSPIDVTRMEVDGGSLTTFVHGLETNTEYDFTVIAENDMGVGPSSTAVTHRTQAGGAVSYPVSDMAFPWWLWLAIAAACLFLIALAIALLFCIACGCCRCCLSCCPGCGALCDGTSACLEPCGAALAGCAAGCCPCCCEDEDDCARCWTKCCCGVPCCVCCGKAYKERRAKAELTGYKVVANGKTLNATNTTQVEGNPPDLWADELIMKQMGKTMVGTPSEMESLNKSEIDSETHFVNHAQHQQVSERYIPSSRSRVEESVQRSARGADYAHVNKGEKPNVNINTTNVRIEEVKNEYQGNEAYSPLGSMQSEGIRTRDNSESQHSAVAGYHDGQIVTFPDSRIVASSGLKPEALTITFEETTTTHSVEKMVPQADGSNVKTVSSHQSFAKSYSTSDASRDRNLQTILRDGLDSGPLAIDVPQDNRPALQAITAPTVESMREQAQYRNRVRTSHDSSSSSGGYMPQTHGYNYSNKDSSHREYNYNTLDSGIETGRDDYIASGGFRGNNYGGVGGGGLVENSSYEETQHYYAPELSAASPPLGRSAVSPAFRDSPVDMGSNPPHLPSSMMGGTGGFSQDTSLHTSSSTLPVGSHLRPGMGSDADYRTNSNYHFHSTSNVADMARSADLGPGMRLRSSSTMSGAGGGRNKWYLGQGANGAGGSAFRANQSEGMDIDRETSFANTVYSGSNGHAASSDYATESGALHATLSHPEDHSAPIPIANGSTHNAGTSSSSYNSSSYHYESGGSTRKGMGLGVPESAPESHLGGLHGGLSYSVGGGTAGGLDGGDTGGRYASSHSMSAGRFSSNNNNSAGDVCSETDVEVAATLSRARSQEVLHRPHTHLHLPKSSYLHPAPPQRPPQEGLLRRAHSANLFSETYGYANENLFASEDDTVSEVGVSEYARRQARVLARVNQTYKQRALSRARSLDHMGREHNRRDNMVNTQTYDYMSNASTRSAMSDRPPYVYSSAGYHSDTNASSQDESASQNSGTVPRTNPLSSFTVPAPPPHFQHPQAKVRITAPTYSPLKRGQPGPGRGRAQPMAVITPKAPDVTYRGVGDGNSPGSTVRTFSAEDLNAEMMHLEGLMKDLNEITQSELQN